MAPKKSSNSTKARSLLEEGSKKKQKLPVAPIDESITTASSPEPSSAERTETLIHELLQELVHQKTRAPKPAEIPAFSGLQHQDAGRHFIACEDALQYAKVPQSQWIKQVTEKFNGAAASWYKKFESIDLDWPTFTRIAARKFDSEDRKTTALIDLRVVRQKNEPVALFLLEKMQLARRVAPEISDRALIQMLIKLLQPKIRDALILCTPATLDDLIDRAQELEEMHHGDEIQAKVESPRPHPLDKTRPLPDCKFCPEKHFHRFCPVLNARNDRRLDDQRRDAPDARRPNVATPENRNRPPAPRETGPANNKQ